MFLGGSQVEKNMEVMDIFFAWANNCFLSI